MTPKPLPRLVKKKLPRWTAPELWMSPDFRCLYILRVRSSTKTMDLFLADSWREWRGMTFNPHWEKSDPHWLWFQRKENLQRGFHFLGRLK